jgi:putative ABC transport system substrate-binding protein
VPKHLELLRALVPNLARLAVLSNPAFPGHPAIELSVNTAIRNSGIAALPFHAERPDEIDAAFPAIVKAGAQVIVVAVDPAVEGAGQRIARLALQHKLPTIFSDGDHVRAGGLISYGENLERTYRRAAVYIGKLLKGSKASALPIEQVTKLDLTINQKTADALGIRIPAAMLARADKVWRG